MGINTFVYKGLNIISKSISNINKDYKEIIEEWGIKWFKTLILKEAWQLFTTSCNYGIITIDNKVDQFISNLRTILSTDSAFWSYIFNKKMSFMWSKNKKL